MAYRILVVDNQATILEFMKALLEKNGHSVETAGSGLEAIDIAKTFLPHIIFVDMVMPHLDGGRLCRILKRIKGLNETLYVIISGIAVESGALYDGSADIYIAKGHFNDMAENIIKVLSHYSEGSVESLKAYVLGADKVFRREITKELLFTCKHLEVLMASMSDGVVEFLTNFKIVYANKAAETLLNIPELELLTRDIRDFIPAVFHDQIHSFCDSKLEGPLKIGDNQPLLINGRYIHLDFLPVIESSNVSILAIFRDVSVYHIAEEKSREALKVKELLLKEINHRVKNNLNLIAGMINLQKIKIGIPEYNIYLDELKGRIQSIELIHDKLSRTGDFKKVDIYSYLNDLAIMIIQTITDRKYGTNFKLTGDNFHAPVKTAITLGLIITELITNAIKYGFGDVSNNPYLTGKQPTLIINITKGKKIKLEVVNNGYPFTRGNSSSESGSLGLSLINDLAYQLSAETCFTAATQEGGTSFVMDFPLEIVE